MKQNNKPDYRYFKEKLSLLLRDLQYYTDEELARALTRFAITSNESVVMDEIILVKGGMAKAIDATKLIRVESETDSCAGCALKAFPACSAFSDKNNLESCIEYKDIHGVESDFIHRHYIYKLKDETNNE